MVTWKNRLKPKTSIEKGTQSHSGKYLIAHIIFKNTGHKVYDVKISNIDTGFVLASIDCFDIDHPYTTSVDFEVENQIYKYDLSCRLEDGSFSNEQFNITGNYKQYSISKMSSNK